MAQSAKDIQLRELKNLVNELKETTKLLRKTLEDVQKEKAAIQQERNNFKEQVDYLTKKLFGSSSEKGVTVLKRWSFLQKSMTMQSINTASDSEC